MFHPSRSYVRFLVTFATPLPAALLVTLSDTFAARAAVALALAVVGLMVGIYLDVYLVQLVRALASSAGARADRLRGATNRRTYGGRLRFLLYYVLPLPLGLLIAWPAAADAREVLALAAGMGVTLASAYLELRLRALVHDLRDLRDHEDELSTRSG